jgi:uncharacterized membrane protein
MTTPVPMISSNDIFFWMMNTMRGKTSDNVKMWSSPEKAANRNNSKMKNAISALPILPALLALALGAVIACGQSPPVGQQTGERIETRAPVNTKTYVYECEEDYVFTARIEGETAWLFLPGKTINLPHVPSGSGARYSSDKGLFWSKGQKAVLEIGGKRYRGCRNNPAVAVWEDSKLNGADFRAMGNEPGWILEIFHEKIVFISDYGESRLEAPTPEASSDAKSGLTTYDTRADGRRLEIVLEGRPCRDTMSGQTFQTTVIVRIDEKEYMGCGRALH